MAQLEFTLRVVSPMFLNGADTRQPEMRAASVRGQLRYWLRAILGARTDDLNWIWEHESAVFGSTGQGSAVSVRIFGTPALEEFPMLPHREGTQANVSKAKAIKPNQSFDLQLVTRPGVNIPSDVFYALQLWSLLGGLGKRSRRMMGAIDIRPKTTNIEWWYEKPQTPDAFKDTLVKILSDAVHSPVKKPEIPPFPVLHPNHSWIIVGSPADDPKEANQEFFRQLLRNSKFKPKQDVFGYAKGSKRRASPVIAQVRKIGDDYYPVITAFRSQPLERANYSDVLRDFMQEATTYYNGIRVWGGW